MMRTLIITDSYDATTDLLIHYIGKENIVRLNFDQWEKIKIHISKNSINFSVSGTDVSDKEISKVLWRKPLNNELETDNYISSELKYIFREIFNYFSHQNKTILIIPNIEKYIGKIVQMTIADNYFQVPTWEVSLNNKLTNGVCVVKSLATGKTNNNKILYTTKTQKEKLDSKYPWFIQKAIKAQLDVTVVYINGKSFAFELKRNKNLIDWRKEINKEKQSWEQHELTENMKNQISQFMNNLNLKFGRLDFLYEKNQYYFLEVNPNGQWGWLDLKNENGLMAEMIKYVSPMTEIKAIVKTC